MVFVSVSVSASGALVLGRSSASGLVFASGLLVPGRSSASGLLVGSAGAVVSIFNSSAFGSASNAGGV